MYLDRQTKVIYGMVATGVIILLLITGSLAYHFGKQATSPETSQVTKQTKTETVKPANVKAFLKAYTTKKKDGDNRRDYRPFMTPEMYQEEVSKEKEPDRKQFGAFMVDYKYQDSDIYINPDKPEVLVKVDYTLTYLRKPDQYEDAQKGIKNTLQLKLTYTKKGNRYLVDRMEPVTLEDVTAASTQETPEIVRMP
ncbi:hypothetical protein [Streptococcus agalactiae]|uniref:hypothetical protein n=1 Tax=Streptococcus agalactiae TaxID=1311 RepID=UPI000332E4F1|nr:hypothetical protein [Streptococcus agalactiae]CCW40263.1 hypothetical protein MSA_14050 [Streptococcus agalactiae ILRI005]